MLLLVEKSLQQFYYNEYLEIKEMVGACDSFLATVACNIIFVKLIISNEFNSFQFLPAIFLSISER